MAVINMADYLTRHGVLRKHVKQTTQQIYCINGSGSFCDGSMLKKRIFFSLKQLHLFVYFYMFIIMTSCIEIQIYKMYNNFFFFAYKNLVKTP
jgi:hypothetical protein